MLPSNVLIVEDCCAQQLYAGQLLTSLNVADISYAANGEQALELLRHKAIDMVLVDLEMEQMNGVELLRVVAAERLCQSVVISSAKDPLLLSSVATMAEADGMQVLGVLAKPLCKDRLNTCLMRYQPQNWPAEINVQAAHLDTQMLQQAIQRHQFFLHYQPIIVPGSGQVVAVEALARWEHPQLGIIAPDRFIALAEQTDYIDQLTLHFLKLALQQLNEWMAQGFDLQLSFNLSPLSLSNPAFVQQLQQHVQQYNVKPGNICWEVTETQDFNRLSTAIHALATLRLQGFGIAIDDYGTGFSNALQLSRIPATRLKLDRSLIAAVSQRPQQRLILESAINLGYQLGLTLIAEGVETREDAWILEQAGVGLMQGYLYHRPLTAQACTLLLSGGYKKQVSPFT